MSSLKTKILVVDDEAQIRRFLRAGISPDEFELLEAELGEEAIRTVATSNPDIVLLDLGLPDIDGVKVVQRLREWSTVPIIVLSARGLEQDKIQALDAGADDYLTKPFALGELLARVRVALRNRGKKLGVSDLTRLVCGELEIDFAARVVKKSGVEVHLTPIEYRLLTLLAQNGDKVITHKQILNEVWGAAYSRQNHYLRVFMGQLRHKIESDPSRPRYLVTEPGVGYRFRLG